MKHFLAIACTALVVACAATPNPPMAVGPGLSTPRVLPLDSRGFSILQTDQATILAEPGVSDSIEREIGQLFETRYRIVSEDLGSADKRPCLYVYISEQSMYQDLIALWGYPEWVRSVHTIPRMHRDYIEWIPPRQYRDVAFVTHEYSHRIIEQIAGLNSQVNFKWFDEGLAECEGQRALVKRSPMEAASQKAARMNLVVTAYASHSLIPLVDITTERQWSAQIERGGQLAYTEAWAALDYLISHYGMVQVKSVLNLIGRGRTFPDAFRETYGLTVDEFEASFRFSLSAKPMEI